MHVRLQRMSLIRSWATHNHETLPMQRRPATTSYRFDTPLDIKQYYTLIFRSRTSDVQAKKTPSLHGPRPKSQISFFCKECPIFCRMQTQACNPLSAPQVLQTSCLSVAHPSVAFCLHSCLDDQAVYATDCFPILSALALQRGRIPPCCSSGDMPSFWPHRRARPALDFGLYAC